MINLKKIMIVPYFGQFPEWMDQYLADFVRTMRPQGYELLLDTDIESFRERVKHKLKIDYPGVRGTGKVHDYRCALGLLYGEEIRSYDYWGTVDLDMCFGEVNKWFPDEMIRQYDVVSNHNTYVSGPFSLYRNVIEVNRLFLKADNWIEHLIYPESNAWVENDFSRLLEGSGLGYKYMSEQGNPWCKVLNLKKENGVLMQDGIPIPMFHFRHFKNGWPI